MGGGRGTRLFPLTHHRAKPAVPIGGKYRLVDIPISNCINSEMYKIYVLTQFNSTSLHRHLYKSYVFDVFHDGFVELLAAEQTPTSSSWYQGTADAVRRQLQRLLPENTEYALILSGDQLYRMDFRLLLRQHIDTGADITIATTPVDQAAARGFGIMRLAADHHIRHFMEKPKDLEKHSELRLDDNDLSVYGISDPEKRYLGSMGIYMFTRAALMKSLDNNYEDFGRHVIPAAMKEMDVRGFVFNGYWEDIGTIGSFYKASLQLVSDDPPFDFYQPDAPIFTHPRYLPASFVKDGRISHALIADGCIIRGAELNRVLVGLRSIIREGSVLQDTIMMGADFFETEEESHQRTAQGLPLKGIGRNCKIFRTILDKDVRIGDDVVIDLVEDHPNWDSDHFSVKDGIMVVRKRGVIPAGMKLIGRL